ncbi:hypothetical protein A2884_01515 [Candidatus Saccharibacteria bacterium RIFCSPHIGHO2_01_FULL_48_12]|nr:MAG: hypothetical protein A2884_01515 [Candidatus Saccharibacteria bacterium RIFCSPHIGHO2_01_FULL_48_12]OGL36525.1 MAG: hypothetical protein A3F38_00065 [Candidatus Saccharibacteria bacterium RIFCSPHIGHO2_12_FULL_48_21]
MFTTLIVQPIFNLLALIYAILPGHNFGVAIIIFTIVVRLLMWPLVKKQLHHARAMRRLQPELKKIKAASKGDRKKESQLVMELYKEREINPFSSIGILLVQIPILIGLYIGISRLVKDPQQIIDLSYPALHNLAWMKELIADISKFDATLFGAVDLTQAAMSSEGLYIPALIIVAAGSISQFFQSKQLMPQDKEARSLRKILSEAGRGKSADQQEVNAALGRNMLYLIPGFVFIIGLGLPSALPLYWLVSSLVAIVQQTIILREDVEEAEALVKNDVKDETVALAEPEAKQPMSAEEASRLRDEQKNAGTAALKSKKKARRRRR